MRELKYSIIFFVLMFSYSCIIPKEGRKLKKSTKEWRNSPVVLEGYSDSPLGSTILMLRENKKFELTSSGLFRIQFEAGSWLFQQDTIHLSFLDKQQSIVKKQNVYLDRKTSTLIFEGEDTAVYQRLKTIINKL